MYCNFYIYIRFLLLIFWSLLIIVIEWLFIVFGFEENGESGIVMLTVLCLGLDFLLIRC